MTWLRRRWQRTSARYRVAWVVGVVVGIGLIANLVLHRPPITYAGTFVATGAMTTPRQGATATLLPDGRVLIAGGTPDGTGTSTLRSAELYDPAQGTFSPTGSMTVARVDATAVLLPDGRVLVAGGEVLTDAATAKMSSAELYDPRTGTFSATGSMTAARQSCSLTLLADGRVLVAGGWDEHARMDLASAELYDPNTGTFTATGSMHVGRSAMAAALLPGGSVLVAGGAITIDANTGSDTASAELYDPRTGAFTTTGDMPTALASRSATLLINGRILVSGGRGVPDFLDGSPSADVYDPMNGTFTPTGSMARPRVRPTAIGLVDGKVLVAGGPGPAELYDPIQGVFTPSGSMVQPRDGGTATILADGQVLIAGGTVGITPISSAELFR
jgi:Galactose oxidase, central domain/Kelch motif